MAPCNPAAKVGNNPAQGGVAVEDRLRLDTGREVVLTLTASMPAVSRVSLYRSGDCEPSVFETRAQVDVQML